MIGWLSGYIVDKQQPGKIVVDVNGVGYDVETTLPAFFNLELEEGLIHLHIHTIVREDALLLYGFPDKKERTLFRALIKVNGVGPKLAIAILSSMTPDEFIQSIYQHDVVALTKLPGIGKKTAERLIIEMKDSIKQLASISHVPAADGAVVHYRQQDEAICALEALGYKRSEASKVIGEIDDSQQSCEQLIRRALQVLAMRQGI